MDRTKGAHRRQNLTLVCTPIGYPNVSFASDPLHALGAYFAVDAPLGVGSNASIFPSPGTNAVRAPKLDDNTSQGGASTTATSHDHPDEACQGFGGGTTTVPRKRRAKMDNTKNEWNGRSGHARVITKYLDEVTKTVNPDAHYTSYSARRGSLHVMGSTDGLRNSDAAIRAGQINTMMALDTFYEYHQGSIDQDRQAGK